MLDDHLSSSDGGTRQKRTGHSAEGNIVEG